MRRCWPPRSRSKLTPDEANPYDSLAEAHNHRGEKDKAIATAKTGIGKKGPPELIAGMKDNLKRFETATRTSDLRIPASLDRAFEPRALTTSAAASDPVAITKHMLDDAKPAVTKACSAKAGKLESAVVRITIGKNAVLERVEVLEPSAGKPLQKCLADAVRALKIPADNPAAKVLIEVPFDPASVPKTSAAKPPTGKASPGKKK